MFQNVDLSPFYIILFGLHTSLSRQLIWFLYVRAFVRVIFWLFFKTS
jgi:hypothetical protein